MPRQRACVNDLGSAEPFPLAREILPAPAIPDVVQAFRSSSGLVLLEGAADPETRGRYSFLAADPIETWNLQEPVFGQNPLIPLKTRLDALAGETCDELPPFQGGIVGCAGYELGRCWERYPSAQFDLFRIPALHAGLYPWVIAWDHWARKCWAITRGWSNGTNIDDPRLAESRLSEVLARLARPSTPMRRESREISSVSTPPAWAYEVSPGLWSDFDRDGYLKAVGRVIEYIRAGDIYQANLSQRLLLRATQDPLELYCRLRVVNPAPFAGLYCQQDWSVVSASPERFLQIDGREISTRPIKGTRRRSAQPEADLFTKDSLRESEKDLAENVMIVDLLRNDLSRVCRPGTVRVPQLCEVETYATVQHLVSEVRGELRDGITAWDALAAALPGGSITGAPKVRAMEIIAEVEPTVRGPYTGSLFYVGCDGRADSNLLIRTFVQKAGWLQCGVGGGVVAQSDAVSEYEETWHKAAGMLRAAMI